MNSNDISEFYERHFDRVWRMCFYYLRNTDDTADAVEDVFYKWITCPKKPQGDKHEIGWLMLTAKNHCLDRLKARSRYADDPEEALDSLSEERDPSEERVRKAVEELPEKYKAVVWLHYYEGMNISLISEVTGVRLSAVKTRLSRARDMLGKSLGGDYDG